MRLFLIFCFSVLLKLNDATFEKDPEEHMNVPQIIERWGYPAEVYEVETSDGYILEMHRIPYGKNEMNATDNKQVIFLQHGLLCASSNWVTNLPNESAAFIFADAGFDVWMGNFRGNTYGKKHKTLKPSQDRFWAFSWDEMAKYDLGSLIEFALNKSGQSQLYYVGHSEGTMAAFARFSTDFELGKKVSKAFMIAPIVTLGHIGGIIRTIAPFAPEVQLITDLFGTGEFLPSNIWIKLAAKYVCGWSYSNPLCENIMFLIAGPGSKQLNASRNGVYVSHTPAGTSVQNVIHFAQGVNSNKFQMYDYYLPQKNREQYGSDTPPLYPLENMEVPIYAFYGTNDVLADPTDAVPGMKRVKNLKFIQECQGFNHLDFIWGLRAAPEIYFKILDFIKSE